MRSPKFEHLTLFAVADQREQLERFLQAQAVPSYRDGHWAKNFKQGGPLEWCNPSTARIVPVLYLAT